MRIKVVAAVLVVAALGGAAYWHFTALDRAIARTTGYVGSEDGDLDLLRDHADDPRVLVAAEALADETRHPTRCRPEKIAVLDAIYGAQPLTGSDGAARAAAAIACCSHAAARSWGSFSSADVAAGVRQALRDKWHGDDNDRLIAWMEEAGVTASEDALTAVARALGTSPKADAYFERGFPADGAALASEPRIPPSEDPRLVAPVGEALLQFTRLTPTSDAVTTSLAAVTKSIKVPVTDEIIQAVLRLDAEGQADVACNLFTAADADRIRSVASARESWAIEAGVLARVLDALGAGSDADVDAIFARLRVEAPDAYDPNLRPEDRQRRTASAARALIGMGARGVASAARHLADDNAAVRQAAIEVLFELDRPHFIAQVVAASPKLAPANVQRAIELAKEDDHELLLRLIALSFPSLVDEVKAELLRLPADTLVPALFGLLARRDSFSPDEVAAYRDFLRSTPQSAAPTARALRDALDRAGDPGRVYWLTKLLALEHLGEVGGPAERALVGEFLADPGGYEYVSIKYDGKTGEELSRSPTQIFFADLARDALAKMR